MEFNQFKQKLQENFTKITEGVQHLFEIGVDRDQLWELYLDSFPVGKNEVYRERREYDDSACRWFVKNVGNVAVIKNNQLLTIWDFETNDDTFQPVLTAMSSFLHKQAVSEVYVSKISKLGTDYNHEQLTDGTIHKWEHLYIQLPTRFVNRSAKSEPEIRGQFRDTRNVFKRSLDELSQESVLTVLELAAQNSLYKGEEWVAVLNTFLEYKKKYDKLATDREKELFAWEQSVAAGGAVGRIRNHSMGTLLVDISKGVELDKAVRSYERIVAPTNYKRPQAIYTKKMLDDARKTISELGYLESLERRHAVLDDITVNNILFSNRDAAKRIAGANVFDDMSASIPVNSKKFSRVEEISAEDFVRNVLPLATELELLLENKHVPNMVSLIAPEKAETPSMFKWNNAFGWAYAGNITDSNLKENVKMAGGNVEGVLRFSIQWNDGKEHDKNDLDAHAIEPDNYRIYFGNRDRVSPSGGKLDVDIINPKRNEPAVENIIWASDAKLKEGRYKMIVDPYSNRGGRGGFRAEVEFGGQIFAFDYPHNITKQVVVAEVLYSKSAGFSIIEKIPSSVSSKEVWGLTTNQFVPVTVAMYSPNYWDEQKGIGHRHYFFMLKDCVNPERVNGFYNEFLKQELDQHKRVFEALGSRMSVAEVEDQLSGIGFSSTKRADVTVKVKGQTERVLKILF